VTGPVDPQPPRGRSGCFWLILLYFAGAAVMGLVNGLVAVGVWWLVS
jgi:hypothetical protein